MTLLQPDNHDKIRCNEHLFDVILNNLRDIIIIAQDGMIKFINSVAAKRYGFELQELRDTPFSDFIVPEFRDKVLKRHMLRLQGAADIEATSEFQIVNTHGEMFWVEITTQNIEWEGRPATLNVVRDVTQRKHTEELLTESENMFRSLVEHSHVGVYIFNSDGMVYVNPVILKMLNTSEENVIGFRGMKYIHPDDLSKMMHYARERLEGKVVPDRYDVRLLTENGETRWIRLIVSIISYKGKKSLLGSFIDITDYKINEAMLNSRLILEKMISGIYKQALRVDDLSVFYNECLKILGETLHVSRVFIYEYRENSYILKNMHEWCDSGISSIKDELITIPATDADWWMKTLSANEVICFNDVNDIPSDYERRALLKIGVKSILSVPFFFGQKFYGFLGIAETRKNREWNDDHIASIRVLTQIMTGVISRKRAEEALYDEKERLGATIKNLHDAVITTNKSGGITMMNHSAEKITGWTFSEAYTKRLADVVHVVDAKTGELFLRDIRAVKDTDILSHNKILIPHDGNEIRISVKVSHLADSAGKYAGSIVVLRNISDELRIYDELHKIQKIQSLRTLAGGIAHEYNNILTSLNGNITLAKMECGENEASSEYLDEAIIAVQRASDLTKKFTNFAMAESTFRKRINVRTAVEETVDFTLLGSGVKATMVFDEQLWNVNIDESKIRQVVQNIIINSIQAMPESAGIIMVQVRNRYIGNAQVSLLKEGRYIELTFSDNGSGIPEEIRNKIFEPFFTTKTNAKGLGLTSAYAVIKQYGGCILVDTEKYGTTVTLYIPADDDVSNNDSEDTMVISPKGKILFIHDNEHDLNYNVNILKSMGYNVYASHTAAHSVEMLRESYSVGSPFDVVIMDLDYSDEQYNEGIHALRQIDEDVAIIIASSAINKDGISTTHVIEKSYKIEDLELIIKNAVNTERMV